MFARHVGARLNIQYNGRRASRLKSRHLHDTTLKRDDSSSEGFLHRCVQIRFLIGLLRHSRRIMLRVMVASMFCLILAIYHWVISVLRV